MPTLTDARPAERYFGNRPIEIKRPSRKGSFNKTHTSVRIALLEAYRQLGGVDGLVKWGREKPDLFYPMLRALLPHELAESGAGQSIRVLVYAPNGKDTELSPVGQNTTVILQAEAQAAPCLDETQAESE